VVLFEHQNLRLLGSKPLILGGVAQLPPTVMHSFKATNNQIRWRLMLGLGLARGIEIDESFDIQVPAST
jgi:hypothetical protein